MKNLLRLSLLLVVTPFIFTNIGCSKGASGGGGSTLTGWDANSLKKSGFSIGNSKYSRYSRQQNPPGMVLIEGGTFTMGRVQDDVMLDWNTTPRRVQVRSYYIDEAEVTNIEYVFYLEWLEKVFPPNQENSSKVYESAVPDEHVWRNILGSNETLSETYLHHPAYANYPVVGVSWLQAVKYCNWRTDRVNEKVLVQKGVLNNLYVEDSSRISGGNNFNTELYFHDPNMLFQGDSTIYTKRLNTTKKNQIGSSAHFKRTDGVLTNRYRLPTEVEWEYAAKSLIENREYNNIRGRKKYSWNGKYSRNRAKRLKGDQLANFKLSHGDYSGLAGWSNDEADITNKVKSYPPNAFGLYDMSGNVSEWVADVYRPIVDTEFNDLNYLRGNVFSKKLIDSAGRVVVADYSNISFDTLENGTVVPNDIPGSVKYIPITYDDAYMKDNYSESYNVNKRDGDVASSIYFDQDDPELIEKMYNNPDNPDFEVDSVNNSLVKEYDKKERTTLIGDDVRVVKGGSWRDREYWLDPSQRRFFPEYMSADYIGFRCAMDYVGKVNPKGKKTSFGPKPRTR